MRVDVVTPSDLAEVQAKMVTHADLEALKAQMVARVNELNHLMELLETIADRQDVPRCTNCYRHARLALPSLLTYEATCECPNPDLATWREWNARSDHSRKKVDMTRAASSTQALPPLEQPYVPPAPYEQTQIIAAETGAHDLSEMQPPAPSVLDDDSEPEADESLDDEGGSKIPRFLRSDR